MNSNSLIALDQDWLDEAIDHFRNLGAARLNLDGIYENISSPGEAGSTESDALTAR